MNATRATEETRRHCFVTLIRRVPVEKEGEENPTLHSGRKKVGLGANKGGKKKKAVATELLVKKKKAIACVHSLGRRRKKKGLRHRWKASATNTIKRVYHRRGGESSQSRVSESLVFKNKKE